VRVSPAASLLLCGVLAAAAPVRAVAQDAYDVELIVFELLNAVADPAAPEPEETAPAGTAERDPPDGGADPAAGEPAQSTNDGFEPLAPEHMHMRATFQRLRDSKDYRPLFHVGWRQQVAGPRDARARTLAEASEEAHLAGSVRVYEETFLHADVDLTLSVSGEPGHTVADSRRLRSGEMSYFDHPRFGALLLVTPAATEPAPLP
jgi:hypothetical protein